MAKDAKQTKGGTDNSWFLSMQRKFCRIQPTVFGFVVLEYEATGKFLQAPPVHDPACDNAPKATQSAPDLPFGIAIYLKGRIANPEVLRILRPDELKFLFLDVYLDFPTAVMAIAERTRKLVTFQDDNFTPYRELWELFHITLKDSNGEIIGDTTIPRFLNGVP